MKAVLISIQPKWVEKIVTGEKTIEVRKTAPKIETPFKCYIYCTNGDELIDIREEKNLQIEKPFVLGHGKSNNVILSNPPIVNRKVIGEFICDEIDRYSANICGWYIFPQEETCLLCDEIAKYGKGKPIYGWHISNLKIYDKPKGVNEFYQPCSQSKNLNCDWLRKHNICACSNKRFLTRPPQSWCYVEIEK